MDSFEFKDNINIMTNLIEKLIIPKFPKITAVDNIDHMSSSFRGDSYFVNLITSECLDTKEQMDIDQAVKQLFKMASLDRAYKGDFSVGSDSIMVFFDCGDGEGFTFRSPFSYKH
jgi:hypothetical protein